MKQDFMFILFAVLVVGVMGYLGYTAFQISDNYIESSCKLGLLKAGLSIFEDIERLEEHKLLCSDSECKLEIQDKISRKEESLKSLVESDFCEEFT